LVVLLVALIFGALRVFHNQPQPIVSGMLEQDNFPDERVEYPDDWPEQLVFPDEFELVSAITGVLPIEDTVGWVCKYRYPGGAAKAEMILLDKLNEYGWQVDESTLIEGGGTIAYLTTGARGTGILVIEPDANSPGESLVSLTIYSQVDE